MEQLQLYIPKLEDLWFREKMMSDPVTMSYNKGWDVKYPGYHRDTGCVDFPREQWESWYGDWINREPQRYYAYIQRCSDGAWLGEVNFHYTPEKDWWDMGIVVYGAYRRMGYAQPALLLMLDHAFRDCGITRLHNNFEPKRDSGWKIHRAVGFREMGVVDGMLEMMLTREEYLSKEEEK